MENCEHQDQNLQPMPDSDRQRERNQEEAKSQSRPLSIQRVIKILVYLVINFRAQASSTRNSRNYLGLGRKTI